MYRDLSGENADFRRGYAEGWCHGKLTEWENTKKKGSSDGAELPGHKNDQRDDASDRDQYSTETEKSQDTVQDIITTQGGQEDDTV